MRVQNQTIPDQIQMAVDQYVELYQVSKQLEERMKGLKDVILQFMKEQNVDQLRDANQVGKVLLLVSERATTTARYTTYDLAEIASLLEPDLLEKCVARVIDKEKLNALSKLGEVSADVLAHKTTKPSYSLSVRLT